MDIASSLMLLYGVIFILAGIALHVRTLVVMRKAEKAMADVSKAAREARDMAYAIKEQSDAMREQAGYSFDRESATTKVTIDGTRGPISVPDGNMRYATGGHSEASMFKAGFGGVYIWDQPHMKALFADEDAAAPQDWATIQAKREANLEEARLASWGIFKPADKAS